MHVIACTALLLCVFVAPAGAAPAGVAPAGAAPAAAPVPAGLSFQEYIDLGTRHFRAGDYARAVAALEAAQRLSQPPRLFFNLARAYHKAGRRADALAMYQRYLKAEPDSPRRPEVEGHIAALRVDLSPPSPPVGTVALAAPPPPPPPPRPLWRKAWFWGALAGGAAAIGAGVTAGVLLSQRGPADPMTTLGTRTVVFP